MDNQIKENTACNSSIYDQIYDNTLIDPVNKQLVPWVKSNYIIPNIIFFSNLLKVNITPSRNIPSQYQYHGTDERNRHGLVLDIDSKFHSKTVQSTFAVTYDYLFDYHSPGRRIRNKETLRIDDHSANCVRPLGNDMYLMHTWSRNVFHFTFHSPNPEPLYKKFRGAFHLNIDCLKSSDTGNIIPYRGFELDPRGGGVPQRFLTWGEVDACMNDFFTTLDVSLNVNDITPFLLRNHGKVTLTYPTNTGATLHLIDDILQPIYDTVVTHTLNPVVVQYPHSVVVPVAAREGEGNVIPCRTLKRIRANPPMIQNRELRGRTLMHGGKRRTLKRRLGR